MSKTEQASPFAGRIDPNEVTDLAILAAHDAWEASDPRRMSLLVGLPATISIGSDSYASKIVSVTPTTITAEYDSGSHPNGKVMTFRATKHGWTCKRHHRLSIGEATAHWDPSF